MKSATAEFEGFVDMERDMDERVARLTKGQLDCLRLVGQHLSSKEIAAELHISPHTVDQRIRNALQTLGVERRTHAARIVGRAPYQRLIHQSPHLELSPPYPQPEEAISHQIRHADRAGGGRGPGFQNRAEVRAFLVLPAFTVRNEESPPE